MDGDVMELTPYAAILSKAQNVSCHRNLERETEKCAVLLEISRHAFIKWIEI